MTIPLVLSTRNRGKVRELVVLLNEPRITLLGMDEVLPKEFAVDECGATFAENARLKAVAVAAATGKPALADDSGLEVDCLGGHPGVRSARYAGDGATDARNNALLLEELQVRGDEARKARFVCALSFAIPTSVNCAEEQLRARGTCEGRIVSAPRGEGGFGYDPLFEAKAFPGRTLAELTAEEKNQISHRAAAVRGIRRTLLGWLEAELRTLR